MPAPAMPLSKQKGSHHHGQDRPDALRGRWCSCQAHARGGSINDMGERLHIGATALPQYHHHSKDKGEVVRGESRRQAIVVACSGNNCGNNYGS